MERNVEERGRARRRTGGPWLPVFLFALVAPLVSACSSGIGRGKDTARQDETPGSRGNVALGLDFGFALTHPVLDRALGGGELATTTATVPRGPKPARAHGGVHREALVGRDSVVFVAFSTAAAADDGDGMGTPLAREAPADTNGLSDVYLAVISSQGIDPNAFTQSLLPVFRHPRCVACHSMAAPDTTAFRSLPHLGAATPLTNPGQGCSQCHRTPSWRAPDASLDFRDRTPLELFDRVTNPPAGQSVRFHLAEDPRTVWAIASGRSPFGHVADDDQDGVLEPEDSDRTIRLAGNGIEDWSERVDVWLNGGQRFSSADSAVVDVALVSRIPPALMGGTPRSANGASHSPSIRFVPAGAPGPVAGTVEVVFASDATNLVGGDTNAATDIFHVSVEVVLDEDPQGNPLAGGINLRVDDATMTRVSVHDGGAGQANGASSAPSLGGADGNVVVFESLATNLLGATPFTDGNGAGEPDVFRHDLDTLETDLVSRSAASATTSGDGGSWRPRVSRDGVGVAFESDASDLVADDTNGVRDVFYGLFDLGAMTAARRASVGSMNLQAGGGDSRDASLVVLDVLTQDVLVAFESDKTDLVVALPPTSTTNAYLFDSRGAGTTTLLNQRIEPGGVTLGSARRGTRPADSGRPVLGPGGGFVLFETLADNLDGVRPGDLNDVVDVMLVDVSQLPTTGFLLPTRISVTGDGASGDGASTAPLFAAFEDGSNAFPVGSALYLTDATNLGPDENAVAVVSFLGETGGAFARFSADPVVGTAPLTVQFTDESSGEPTTWDWDFGDGLGTSTEPHPSYVYTTPGTYSVTLSIDSRLGPSQQTKTSFVEVLAQPTFTNVLADWDTTCVACHFTGNGFGTTLIFGPDDTTPVRGTTYASLMGPMGLGGVASGSSGCAGEDLVVPGDGANSVLFRAMNSSACTVSAMAYGKDADLVERWIDAGALDD